MDQSWIPELNIRNVCCAVLILIIIVMLYYFITVKPASFASEYLISPYDPADLGEKALSSVNYGY